MAEAVWELLKALGSVVGLLTGLFVVWDRFFRHSPTAILVSRELTAGNSTKGLYLRVTNRPDRPILLSWENGTPVDRFGIAVDNSLKGIAISLSSGRTTIVLDSRETRDLLVHRPVNRREIALDNRVECDLFWSYAQPIIWQRDRRIRVSMPMRSLRLLDPDEYREL